MESLPPIAGFAFGIVLAAILEIAKKFGLSEDQAGPIALVLGVLWAAGAVILGQYPGYTDAVGWVISLILVFASIPLGAKVGYKGIVQPVAQNRWNKNEE